MKIRKPVRALRLLFVFLIGSAPVLQGGAWTQSKGHFYSKLTLINLNSTQRFAIDGNPTRGEFDDLALYFYGEYGITDNWTITISNPVSKNSVGTYGSFRGTTRSFFAGDVEIGLKRSILKGPVVVSAVVGSKIPLFYETDAKPPLGTGKTDLDAKLLVGTSFYPIPAYMTGDIGYRHRSSQFEDEINYNFEAGYTLFKKYLVRGVLSGLRCTKNTLASMSDDQFSTEQEQYRAGAGLIYLLSKNIEFDVTFLKTYAGRNFPRATEIYFGVAFKK
ncbi:MAG: hypothetical protein DWQ10_17890 [Calditrichaeota bacterium]|nr:MAG: hypothetical protein DWQ10_17890 [Calditrichota bacterium]